MPTKGKLPTARELEGQVLAALQELDGDAHYTEIDSTVGANLDPWVYRSEFTLETGTFYRKKFSDKTSRARRALRKQRVLCRGTKKGHWAFNAMTVPPSPSPSPRDKAIIRRLTELNVPQDTIIEIRELLAEQRMENLEAHPDSEMNLRVEQKAIEFIQQQEKGWHRPANSNNPGFDLYQTGSGRRNGTKTVWCEVKSLSANYTRVSLTKTEFETALQYGDAYWLYVVENVGTDTPSLIKIQNPAGKTQRFSFGHAGWEPLADN